MEPMRRTKLQRLVATYDRFSAGIADIPDHWAEQLHRTSRDVAGSTLALLAKEGGPKPSEIASGLEQGLRETPHIIAAVSEQYRHKVSQAFYNAIAADYPDFFSKDSRRADKVLARGHIKTESEFYLVRHLVDTLEGDPSATARLQQLYTMLGAYELRA